MVNRRTAIQACLLAFAGKSKPAKAQKVEASSEVVLDGPAVEFDIEISLDGKRSGLSSLVVTRGDKKVTITGDEIWSALQSEAKK